MGPMATAEFSSLLPCGNSAHCTWQHLLSHLSGVTFIGDKTLNKIQHKLLGCRLHAWAGPFVQSWFCLFISRLQALGNAVHSAYISQGDVHSTLHGGLPLAFCNPVKSTGFACEGTLWLEILLAKLFPAHGWSQAHRVISALYGSVIK